MSGLTIGYLEELGKKLSGPQFVGVYPCDILPNVKNKPVFSVIFNLAKHNQEGTHYVAIVANQRFLTYFDSFGKPCQNVDIKNFIANNKLSRKVLVNTQILQHENSNFCGFYCLAFILSNIVNNISLNKFVKYFHNKTNLLLNDNLVIKYILDCIKNVY
jgi:hypothetical protein